MTSFFKEIKSKEKKVYIPKRSPIKKKAQKHGHKFSVETKRAILLRDNGCINPRCEKKTDSYTCHHVYFHREEKIYDFEQANIADKGVLLCNDCHDSLHHRGNRELDNYCHSYLSLHS